MKKILWVLLVFIGNNSIAQFTFGIPKFDGLVHNNAKFSLRTSPFSLADPMHPNFTIGAEYMLKNNQAVGLDYSFILNVVSGGGDYHRGFIIRPTYKFFFNTERSQFIELDFFWKKLYTPQTDWLGMNIVNGVPSYYQFMNYNIIKDVNGINVKFGKKQELFDSRIFFEIYIGLGVRFKRYKIEEFPDSNFNIRELGTFARQLQTNETYWSVSFPMGVRVVVPIK